MQAYVLLALAGFLLVIVAGIGIGTLMRRARPIATPPAPRPVVPPDTAAKDEAPTVLPFDDSTVTDETQPARPIALIAFSPLPDVANQRADLPPAVDDDGIADPDQLSLLIEPDDELSPQQRNVRRLIAYFREKTAASETAAAS